VDAFTNIMLIWLLIDYSFKIMSKKNLQGVCSKVEGVGCTGRTAIA